MEPSKLKAKFLDVFDVLKDIRNYLLFFAVTLFSFLVLVLGVVVVMLLSKVSYELAGAFLFLFGLIYMLISLYGGSASGILILNNNCQHKNITIKTALRQALKTSHRLIISYVLVILAVAVAGLVISLLVSIAAIPFIGQIYAIVAVPVVAILMLALFLFLVTLGPILSGLIWDGFNLSQTFTALVNIYKKNIIQVFIYNLAILLVVVPIVGLILGFFASFGIVSASLMGLFDSFVYLTGPMYGSMHGSVPFGALIGLYLFFLPVLSVFYLVLIRLVLFIYQKAQEDVVLTQPLSSVKADATSGFNRVKSEIQDVTAKVKQAVSADNADNATTDNELTKPSQSQTDTNTEVDKD